MRSVLPASWPLEPPRQTIRPQNSPPRADGVKNIPRTIRLLATSTPEKRNTVRILFYGQSITRQRPIRPCISARKPWLNPSVATSLLSAAIFFRETPCPNFFHCPFSHRCCRRRTAPASRGFFRDKRATAGTPWHQQRTARGERTRGCDRGTEATAPSFHTTARLPFSESRCCGYPHDFP